MNSNTTKTWEGGREGIQRKTGLSLPCPPPPPRCALCPSSALLVLLPHGVLGGGGAGSWGRGQGPWTWMGLWFQGA